MEKISRSELRKIQIKMLKYIKNICEQNNIRYFLFGGTLIGAVRHKGYIPWDDDVDICVPYKDYRRLINIINSKNEYKVLNPYDNEDYYYFFSKMVDKRTILIEDNYKKIKDMGVFLDIFPICNMPNDKEELDKYVKKVKKLERSFFRMYGFKKYYYNKNLIIRIIKAIIFFIPYLFKKKIYKNKYKLLNLLEKYESEDTDYVGNVLPPCTIKGMVKKEVYDESTYVQFEDEMYSASAKYDQYLTQVYGNYMTPPPENERIAPHMFDAFWKNKVES